MSAVKCAKLSLPVRGAWIEIITSSANSNADALSLPVRGAWIEILTYPVPKYADIVAPCEGSVD